MVSTFDPEKLSAALGCEDQAIFDELAEGGSKFRYLERLIEFEFGSKSVEEVDRKLAMFSSRYLPSFMARFRLALAASSSAPFVARAYIDMLSIISHTPHFAYFMRSGTEAQDLFCIVLRYFNRVCPSAAVILDKTEDLLETWPPIRNLDQILLDILVHSTSPQCSHPVDPFTSIWLSPSLISSTIKQFDDITSSLKTRCRSRYSRMDAVNAEAVRWAWENSAKFVLAFLKKESTAAEVTEKWLAPENEGCTSYAYPWVRCSAVVGGKDGRCANGEETMLACGKCKVVRYCSREHQKAHWKIHKHACFPPTW